MVGENAIAYEEESKEIVKIKCPKCGEEIDSFEMIATETNKYSVKIVKYKDYGYLDAEEEYSEFMDREAEIFYCPKCGEEIFSDYHEFYEYLEKLRKKSNHAVSQG